MNISRFLEHWSIVENPFRAEEARHDPVFSRLGVGPTAHPDFEKIAGDVSRPSTAVVFGEKGSGKTAIRLQIAERVGEHNLRHPDDRVLLVAYDDLNPVLERFCRKQGVTQASEPKAIIKALKSVRLVDHIDAIVALATRRMTDQVLGRADQESANALGEKPAGQLRKADRSTRADLLLLAAVYGDPAAGEGRLEALRKTLNVHRGPQWYVERAAAFAGWALPAAALIGAMLVDETADTLRTAWLVVAIILGVAWVALVVWVYVWKKVSLRRLAGKIAREVRTGGRDGSQLHAAMEQVPAAHRRVTPLPVDADDDTRYALLDRLRGVLRALHCRGVIVIVDRVDEPTLINGDAERMRAVIWPLLNNKFLQQDGMGLKLLLPIELRHELFRETSNFFQEARLDKQSLVERLTWTGATLFDLCNARLNACRASNAEPISLVDLFEENVSRTDVIDALDQMHQPRDAFKLLYHCIQEHCANVTEEEGAWRIPRLTLETVRRQQAERVQMLYRGIAPA